MGARRRAAGDRSIPPPPLLRRSTHCPENAAYCWTCADGTRQDPRTGACVRCSAGCATCDVDQYSGREKCWSCQQGYELQEAVEQPHELSAIQLCAPKKR